MCRSNQDGQRCGSEDRRELVRADEANFGAGRVESGAELLSDVDRSDELQASVRQEWDLE
jgi:hypothetical protein